MTDTYAGPACRACGDPAVVHWQRRLSADEIATLQQAEQDKRNDKLTTYRAIVASLDGSDSPPPPLPEFGPMPDFADATTPVYGCAQHGITLDEAARIHQHGCAAPPVCDCKPEQLPAPDPEPDPIELPPGW